MAAAAPPSAITVWALPKSDFVRITVRMPCSRASIAARRPAPPAPITTTSKSYRSTSVLLVASVISQPTGERVGAAVRGRREDHDVGVGDDHREQRRHGERAVV